MATISTPGRWIFGKNSIAALDTYQVAMEQTENPYLLNSERYLYSTLKE